MNRVVADTQAIVWYLFAPARLSPAAAAALAAAETDRILISTISLVEVSYLSEKRSFPYGDVLPNLLSVVEDPNEPIDATPVTTDTARTLHQVPRAEVPDMPDRIIAATGVALGLPIVSSDAAIRGSAFVRSRVPVIW